MKRKGEKMKISEFFEYNNQQVLEENENILEYLEKIFGKSTEIDREGKKEFTFGKVIGLVTDSFLDEKTKRQKVSMLLCDADSKLLLWNGRPVEILRTNPENRLEEKKSYIQGLFFSGSELFTRNPQPCEEVPGANMVTSFVSDLDEEIRTAEETDENILSLKNKLEDQGYHCNIKVLAQFLLGLNTNQLIILHGAPGMGKTSFVSNIARALGFAYKIIPVRPNWIDNQDLTGYFNPVERRYYSTPFLDALCEAKENPQKHYLICLDEMNLAHVEYYFSDVLSSMESGEGIPLYAHKDQENAWKRQEAIMASHNENTVEWLDAKTDQENLKNRYDKAEENVEHIADALEKHQVRLLKDSAMMDKMYEQNLLYFKELSMYIQAGKQRLAQTRNGKLHDLEEKAKMTGLPEDAQAAKDLDSKCARFEKKLHDLELTRMISLQTAPQIRLVQNNDTMMAEKIQTTLVNTIPLWKSQMVLALGIAHSTEAAQAQSQVSDLTNELLRKNAEKLHMASVETAKESERGIVDMETLQKTNADLIQTLDDVMKIQKEGREKRQAAEAEMVRMENDLKAKLLEIQH